jgi:ribosomal protein S16
MLKFKLIQGGQKHKSFYTVGIMQATTKLKGLIQKKIGFYNPNTHDFKISVNLLYQTLNYGVQPTNKIKFILKKAKIIKNT